MKYVYIDDNYNDGDTINLLQCNVLGHTLFVTGFEKIWLSGVFYILRNIILKHSNRSGSLMPNCRDARFTA